MKIFTTGILLLFSISFFAQEKYTLSGNVKDAATGEDLIGVTVLVESLNTGAATNVYGFYSITLPEGTYKFQYRYIGYTMVEKTVELKADVKLSVDLTLSSTMLNDVVITAEQKNNNITSAKVGMNRIEPKILKKLPAAAGEVDVVKSLQLLPGISSTSESSAGFNVRGGASDQNLLLLDEGVLYNSAHLFGLFSVYNPDAVKDLEIYKGGIPARYGGRLSSVLDVRQKEGNNKEFGGSAGIGLISSKLLLEGPLVKEKSSFLIAGRRSYADAFLALSNNENTAFFYDLNLKANYILGENDRLYLSGYFGRDRFEIKDLFTNIWGNATGTLRWNHFFGPKLFSNFSLIYSKYDYAFDDLASGASFRRTSDITNLNSKAEFTYYLNDKNKIETGFNFQTYTFNPGETKPINNSSVLSEKLDEKRAQEGGFYVSNEQKIAENLTAIYGLRISYFNRVGGQTLPEYRNDSPIEYNEELGLYEDGEVIGTKSYSSGESIKDFINWEPRLALNYVLNEKSSVKASYQRTYQYLHLISNNTSITPLDVWAPSGEFLKPQESDQVSLGYFRNFKDNAYEASVEVFGKKMNNILDYVPGADFAFNNTIETEILAGDGRAYGMELYVKKTTGKLTGWISYTLARTERQIKGLGANDPGINDGKWYVSNYDKTHDFSITSIYEFNKRWTFSANFIFATGLPTSYPESGYKFLGLVVPQYEERNNERIPSYHRLDLSATLKGVQKENKNTSHEWVFGIYNAYNRANANAINFREDADNPGRVKAIKTSVFGIVPNISYQLKF